MQDLKNRIIKAFNYREATKEFVKDKLISENDFSFILETGRLSPSSFGWEPWKFLVVQNKELREKLKDGSWGAQKQLETASHFVLILGRRADQMKVGSEYFKYMSKEVAKLPDEVEQMRYDVFDKFQKMDFDLTDDRKIFDWVGKQCYIAMGNMMTAAAQIGIDSCPMEGFDKDKIDDLIAKENLVDTMEFGVVSMVAFGYRKDSLEWNKARRPIEEVVLWV